MVERPARDQRDDDPQLDVDGEMTPPMDETVDDAIVDADNPDTVTTDEAGEELPKSLLAGNYKLQIWLIAGVFYAILIAMCLFVGVLVFRG